LKTTVSFQQILVTFFLFIGLLIFVRIIYSGKINYLFLVWNIFLAWVPFVISSSFKKITDLKKWKQLIVFCCWLVFFPNALYIITDLIHLEKESIVPKWFDAILIFSSSIVGLIMAFVSLFRVHQFLQFHFNSKITERLIVSILFLASFGIYLGRFLRWNSWDIISNPFGLIISIGERFIFPLQHLKTWGITFILTTLFYLLYLIIKKLPDGVTTASSRQTPLKD
jgi:uncharacterized membrane protein